MHQPARDLFGQVPVSFAEIDQWLLAVPRIDPSSPRAANYVRFYDVPGKIAAAKLAGHFEAYTQRSPQPVHWWERFRWS